MRSYFEELEHHLLSPLAVKSSESKGRRYDEIESSTRTVFQRDRDRIIHSKAFRRLKHKTQVFVSIVSDHYRSRLTHTIEVAQITRHLSRLLQLNEDLAECIALAHDLGHSPFGHSGEDELNDLLKNFGGFEHNAFSLKIVDEIEKKYPQFNGLNLSYEVKEGLKKHETPWDNPKTAHSKFSYVTLEAQVANVADQIAYNNHDLDDGLQSGLLSHQDLIQNVQLWREANENISKQYSSLQEHERFHLINSYLISEQVTNVFKCSMALIEDADLFSIDEIQELDYPLVNFDQDMLAKNSELRKYLFSNMYQHESITSFNNKGKTIIRDLFHVFRTDDSLVPDSFQALVTNDFSFDEAIGDYIASMTDSFAIKLHKQHCQ